MTRQRRRLVAHALRQTAIAGDHEGVVVRERGTEAGAQVLLRQRHADGVRDALAQGTRGDLDAGGVSVLGVAGSRGSPLPEGAEVVELETEPGQVQRRVEQHRRVAGGKDEAVAVGPRGIGGVVGHDPREQDVGQGREGHRGPLMARLGLLHCVHGQGADHVDTALFEVRHSNRSPPPRVIVTPPGSANRATAVTVGRA